MRAEGIQGVDELETFSGGFLFLFTLLGGAFIEGLGLSLDEALELGYGSVEGGGSVEGRWVYDNIDGSRGIRGSSIVKKVD
jgi:hypothetical protein